VLRPGGGGAVSLLGAGGTPRRARTAEDALAEGASLREGAALAGALAPDAWRRALVADLVLRALEEAAGRVSGASA
jgi:hypothetical protein